MSQIATTIEQSKRLLAAGIDPESADMKHTRFDDEIPAWSLSRLWDLLSGTVLGGWFSLGSDKSEEIIECLVQIIENRHANH